jgi:hypothetical protein
LSIAVHYPRVGIALPLSDADLAPTALVAVLDARDRRADAFSAPGRSLQPYKNEGESHGSDGRSSAKGIGNESDHGQHKKQEKQNLGRVGRHVGDDPEAEQRGDQRDHQEYER